MRCEFSWLLRIRKARCLLRLSQSWITLEKDPIVFSGRHVATKATVGVALRNIDVGTARFEQGPAPTLPPVVTTFEALLCILDHDEPDGIVGSPLNRPGGQDGGTDLANLLDQYRPVGKPPGILKCLDRFGLGIDVMKAETRRLGIIDQPGA